MLLYNYVIMPLYNYTKTQSTKKQSIKRKTKKIQRCRKLQAKNSGKKHKKPYKNLAEKTR